MKTMFTLLIACAACAIADEPKRKEEASADKKPPAKPSEPQKPAAATVPLLGATPAQLSALYGKPVASVTIDTAPFDRNDMYLGQGPLFGVSYLAGKAAVLSFSTASSSPPSKDFSKEQVKEILERCGGTWVNDSPETWSRKDGAWASGSGGLFTVFSKEGLAAAKKAGEKAEVNKPKTGR